MLCDAVPMVRDALGTIDFWKVVFFSALFLLQLLGDEKVGNSEQVIEKWGMYKDRCPTTTVVVVASKAL